MRRPLAALLLFACTEAPPPGPASAPAPRFEKPEPLAVDYAPPPGVRACRYRLEETTTAARGEAPVEAARAELTYVLESAADLLAAVVLRVRTETKVEGYQAELDSARPGDQQRVAGGAETVVAPRTAELFSLLDAPIRIRTGDRPELDGGAALRAAFVKKHPAAIRDAQARATSRLSDEQVLGWLLPWSLDPDRPSPGETDTKEARFSHDGLVAEGQRARRTRMLGDRELVEVREAFVAPGEPSPLLGTRERTVERDPGDPCFSQAGETWTIRLRTPEGDLDRTRTRVWYREDVTTQPLR